MSHLLQPIPFQPLLLREYHDILKQQYHKRFTLTPTSPTPDSESRVYKCEYWTDDRLQSMKKRLNETKSQLNNLPWTGGTSTPGSSTPRPPCPRWLVSLPTTSC